MCTFTGTRRDMFLEVEFAQGDPDLAVGLIMTLPAPRQFCRRRSLPSDRGRSGRREGFRASAGRERLAPRINPDSETQISETTSICEMFRRHST
jgi:hypothetical protein